MKTLKYLRTELGLTQIELAEFLKISRSRLSMAESGKRLLDSKTLIKLADVEIFINNKQKHQLRKMETLPVPEESVLQQHIHDLSAKRIRVSLQISYPKNKLERQKINYEIISSG